MIHLSNEFSHMLQFCVAAVLPFKQQNGNTAALLSACAEDRGLCPWMNAQNVAKYFTHRHIAASADFAIGG